MQNDKPLNLCVKKSAALISDLSMPLTPTATALACPPSSSAQINLSPSRLWISYSSSIRLLCLHACGSVAARAVSVYLSELSISAYCQWKPRKLITKLIMVPGVGYMLCMCLLELDTLTHSRTHTHTLCHPPPPLPHVMPVTCFPGKQLSKSESDFYF